VIWLLAAIACVVAILLWGEAAHWRSSRRGLGSRPGRAGTEAGKEAGTGPGTVAEAEATEAGTEAVVVLGFRNRGTHANLINRWRVRAGLRSQDPGPGSSMLVLSGGAVGSSVSEAELMATYARVGRHYAGPLVTETESRTTWENIQHVIPLIETADRIKIVSNSLHAEKARAYLWKQRPDLAERLVQAADYRFGELILLKPLMAALGFSRLHSRSARARATAASR
jgi:hypothetical protein